MYWDVNEDYYWEAVREDRDSYFDSCGEEEVYTESEFLWLDKCGDLSEYGDIDDWTEDDMMEIVERYGEAPSEVVYVELFADDCICYRYRV